MKKNTFKTFLLMGIMSLWFILCMYPLAWTFINSLRPSLDIMDNSWGLPTKIKLENYSIVFDNNDFWIYLKNTVLVVVFSLLVLIVVGTMCSFALSRFKFKWNIIVYSLIVAGVLLPQHASIIPLFVMMKQLNFLDKTIALIIPYVAFSIPTTVFILVAFMKSLPHEIEEAAIMDGTNLFKMYTSIIFPMAMPAIITIMIFEGIAFWNEFMFPLLFTSSNASRTLSIGIRVFVGKRRADFGAMLASVVIFIIPTLVFYFSMSDKIIKGMVSGAVKG